MSKNENDIVQYQHDGQKHWAAQGSKAYQKHVARDKGEAAPVVITPKVEAKPAPKAADKP